MLLRLLGLLVALIVAVALYVAVTPSPIDPEPNTPPTAPALTGPLAPNDLLAKAKIYSTLPYIGPEDLLVEPGPKLTAGMRGGELVELTPGGTPRVLASTGGRPLGLARDRQGRLLIADADKGLLRLEADGKLTSLATGADNRPFRFVNELAVASDGSVYFSDSSDRWAIKDFCMEALEGRSRGRILRWDPSGAVRVLADGRHFPNGVALSVDQSVLYFAESTRYAIQQLHLTGPKAGQVEPFAENLPGFPDNLWVTPRGTVWTALFSQRDPLLDMVSPYAWARALVSRLPRKLWEDPAPYGMALELSADGKPLRSVQDPTGRVFPEVTTAVEVDGTLWLGTIKKPQYASIKL